MIFNPIIHREVLSALRTRKAIIMQALLFVAAAVLIWRNWPADGLQALGGMQAQKILSALAIGELALVALFAPAFTAASLTSERERNTLESVFTSLLKPWEIAVGKMVGSLAFLVLVVLGGGVALCVPFLLGGVGWQDVLAVLGLLLLTAVYLGMIGMLISSVMHRSYRAIIVTYGVLVVLLLFCAFPAWPIGGKLVSKGPPAVQAIVHLICSLSPLQAMLSLVLGKGPYTSGAENMPPFWVTYIYVSLAVIVGTTVACLYKLRRPVGPPRPRESLRVVERGGKVTARSVLFIVDPRKRKHMIRWWQNPLLMKEFRTRPMLQAQWLLRSISIAVIAAFILPLIVSAGFQAFVMGSTGDLASVMAWAVSGLMAVMLILLGPAATSGAICGDIETGFGDLLRMTRIASWRIVSAKFQATIIPLLLLSIAVVPSLGALWFLAEGGQQEALAVSIPRIFAVAGVTVLFIASLGMFFSSICARTSTATAWTYTLVVLLGLVSLLVLLDPGAIQEKYVTAMFKVNPVAAALGAAGEPSMQDRGGIWGPYLRIMGIASGVLFVVTTLRVFRLRRTH